MCTDTLVGNLSLWRSIQTRVAILGNSEIGFNELGNRICSFL